MTHLPVYRKVSDNQGAKLPLQVYEGGHDHIYCHIFQEEEGMHLEGERCHL